MKRLFQRKKRSKIGAESRALAHDARNEERDRRIGFDIIAVMTLATTLWCYLMLALQ